MAIEKGYSITFPVWYPDGVNYCTLKITIENTNEASISAIDPVTNFIFIDKISPLTMKYDLDDPLIVPGEMDITLFDRNNTLADILFDNTDALFISPIMEVYFKLNSPVIYEGVVLEDSVEWDETTKMLSFKVLSNVDLLNQQLLYDLENATHFNPHGYSFSVGAANWPRFDVFLTNIFQTLSPTITVNVYSNWSLQSGSHGSNNLFAHDHRINHWPFYYYPDRNDLGLKTEADVLRMICDVFRSYCGVVSRTEAFFKELFTYDSGNTQTLGEIKIYKKQFRYIKIDYVKLVSHEGVNEWTYTEGDVEKSGIDVKKIERDPFYHAFGGSYTNMVWETGLDSIDTVTNSIIDSTPRHSLAMAAKEWFHFRNNCQRQRTDYFLVKGIDYSFYKNFTYQSRNYAILELNRDFINNETEIIAIKV